MFLTNTNILISKYRGKFIDGTISIEEFQDLCSTQFKHSITDKMARASPPTDDAHTITEAKLDFVAAIAPMMSQECLHNINMKILAASSSSTDPTFFRGPDLAKYFLAYEANHYPIDAHIVLNHDKIIQKLIIPGALNSKKIFSNFVNKIILPAKISLLIHMAEVKATQLNNESLSSDIVDMKGCKLYEAYRAFNKKNDLRKTNELHANLLRINIKLDHLLSKDSKTATSIALDGPLIVDSPAIERRYCLFPFFNQRTKVSHLDESHTLLSP